METVISLETPFWQKTLPNWHQTWPPITEHFESKGISITKHHGLLLKPNWSRYDACFLIALNEISSRFVCLLFQLAAYKTPKDKVACVARCCQTIMNLLKLSSTNSVPAADQFLPVLIFVVIKANPASLLSTVQYIESFYGTRLASEDQYWWIQFVSAVEFIKTMIHDMM